MFITTCTKTGSKEDIKELIELVKHYKPQFNYKIIDYDCLGFTSKNNSLKLLIKVGGLDMKATKINNHIDKIKLTMRYWAFDGVVFDAKIDKYFSFRSLPQDYYLRTIKVEK